MARNRTKRPSNRKRGAQPGNVNSVRYGYIALWNRGVILPQDRWILPFLTKYRAGLYSDKGGESEMSFGEQALVDIAITAHACKLLAVRDITGYDPKYGSLGLAPLVEHRNDGSTKLKPVYEVLPKYLDCERHSLMDLGLPRRAKNLPSPNWYEIADEQNGNGEHNDGENPGGTDDEEEET